MTNPILETARHFVSARVSPIPIRADGSKASASTLLPIDQDTLKPSWKPYQTRLATDEELVHWFSKPNVGLAIVAGEVSGNLEILDIDEPALVRPWYELVEREAPGLVSRFGRRQDATSGARAPLLLPLRRDRGQYQARPGSEARWSGADEGGHPDRDARRRRLLPGASEPSHVPHIEQALCIGSR
jgi:hypothetical protein